MKVSIITVVYNNKNYVEECIKSVLSQTHGDIEYIIIDSESTDGTLDIINKYKDRISRVVSEKDPGHIHAFNKGINLASGEIIGFLHSDDMYADNNVVYSVVKAFNDSDRDCVYGDLVYVQREDPNKVVRYWRAGEGDRAKIARGWMPPHPSLFIKHDIYKRYGVFNTDFKISADYEIILRFLYMHRISMCYIHKLCVKMRTGGISNRNILRVIQKSYEDYKACKTYGINKATYALMLKNFRKIPQFFNRGTYPG